MLNLLCIVPISTDALGFSVHSSSQVDNPFRANLDRRPRLFQSTLALKLTTRYYATTPLSVATTLFGCGLSSHLCCDQVSIPAGHYRRSAASICFKKFDGRRPGLRVGFQKKRAGFQKVGFVFDGNRGVPNPDRANPVRNGYRGGRTSQHSNILI